MRRVLSRWLLVGMLISFSGPLVSAEREGEDWWRGKVEFCNKVGSAVIAWTREGFNNHYGKIISGVLSTTALAFVVVYLRIRNKCCCGIGRV